MIASFALIVFFEKIIEPHSSVHAMFAKCVTLLRARGMLDPSAQHSRTSPSVERRGFSSFGGVERRGYCIPLLSTVTNH